MVFLPPMEWIEQMIRIDSSTHKTNEPIVRFLTPFLRESGLTLHEQLVRENGQAFVNLIATSHGPNERDLLALNTHLDTVSAGEPSSWTKTAGDPFRATRVRDRIYGLGAADVKLDFLCKILAARNAKPWKRPFALVGTFGEERGLVGATHLFNEALLKPKYALVGEPSNLELIYAHKGHLICTLGIDLDVKNVAFLEPVIERRWKGKSAHSSTPDLGENALRKGLMDIFKRSYGIVAIEAGTDTNKIPDRCVAKLVRQPTAATQRVFEVFRRLEELGSELKKTRDARFSPPTNTLSLNMARTESGELLLSFDIRSLPEQNAVKLNEKVLRLTKLPYCRIVSLTQDLPLKGKRNSRFLKAVAKRLKSCGVAPVAKTKASSTEAAVYNAHGAEAIVFGPGLSIGNVHRPNEYNSLDQMEIATRFYTACLLSDSEDF